MSVFSGKELPDVANRHARRHPPGPIESCFECGRLRAVCKRKRPFADVTEARVEALRINVANGYDPRISVYPCGWCGALHLTSHPGSATKRRWASRAERMRRKALIRAVTA